MGDFRKRGQGVGFYDGVEEWFNRIDEYGREKGVNIEHYVLSSGNGEIIEGTRIADKFKAIYASRFLFDQHEVAIWPAQAVNYTTKTQFLFRINKGAHDLSDDRDINKFVEMRDRPIPFANMVYLGDGETDVPCFRLVKEQGGFSVAVYKPSTKNARSKAEGFLAEGRVHCVVPADYRPGEKLDRVVKAQIDLVAARANLQRTLG